MSLPKIRQKLRSFADEKAAASAQRFFKTGTGELGDTFEFLGVRTPQLRQLVREYPQITFTDARTLLRSKIHEERTLALLILVRMFAKGDEETRKKVFDFYLKNRRYYSSWALVDASARDIAGKYLEDKNRQPLYDLAQSASHWDRRIAIVATQQFIRRNDFADTLKISDMLL